MKKGDQITLTIEKLTFGGMGLGKHEGRAVFVPLTVPQDVALVRLNKIKKQYLEARLVQLETPSPLRIQARCRHFGECGGCVWQFLDYTEQLKAKKKLVRETLDHLGNFHQVPVLEIIPVDNPWFYRNKMEYSFNPDDDRKCKVGLHPAQKYYEVFDLTECFLPTQFDAALVAVVRDFARQHDLIPFNYKSNSGLLRSLFIRSSRRTGQVMVNLATSEQPFPRQKEFAEMVRKKCSSLFTDKVAFEGFFAHPELVSIYHTVITTKKGHKTHTSQELLYGHPTYAEKLEVVHEKTEKTTLLFDVLPQAFFQPNPIQAEKLYSAVLRTAALTGNEVVWDLFCGTGTISLCLAPFCRNVTGIDIEPQAINNAKNNASKNRIENADFIASDVEKIFLSDRKTPDILVCDPPRAGISKHILEKIGQYHIQKIIYISCNPATFVRDAKILTEAGYSLEWVQPIDMLPHTAHIETVSLLQYNG